MYNKVILIGRAGNDIEVKFTPSGTKVAKFRMATSRSYMDSQGGWQQKTEWHNIVLWGRLADKAEKTVRKGGLYFIEGSIEYSNWEDQSGNKRYRTEIRANSLIPLTQRSAESLSSSMGEESSIPSSSSGTSAPPVSSPEPDNIKTELDEIEEPKDDFEEMGDEDVPF